MQDDPEVSPQIVRTPRRSRLRSPAIALSLVPLCPSCRLVPLALLFFFLLLVPVNPSAAIRLFPRPPERKGCIIEQEAVEGSDSPLTPSTIALTLSESQTE